MPLVSCDVIEARVSERVWQETASSDVGGELPLTQPRDQPRELAVAQEAIAAQ